jgi:hypothetical protein
VQFAAFVIVFDDTMNHIIFDRHFRHEGTIVIIVFFDGIGFLDLGSRFFLFRTGAGRLLLAGTDKQSEKEDEKYSHDAWSFKQI